MGRTYRKDSDYGSKRDSKDQQRQLRKRDKKLQKLNNKLGNGTQDADVWLIVQRNRM